MIINAWQKTLTFMSMVLFSLTSRRIIWKFFQKLRPIFRPKSIHLCQNVQKCQQISWENSFNCHLERVACHGIDHYMMYHLSLPLCSSLQSCQALQTPYPGLSNAFISPQHGSTRAPCAETRVYVVRIFRKYAQDAARATVKGVCRGGRG